MIYQYAYNIHSISGFQEVSDFLAFVSEERRDKISRFRFDEDKIRSLFAEIVCRYALWEKYAIRDCRILNTEYGKPYLKDHKDIFFNVSHSGDWVVCALGDRSLGIDVEKMEEIEISVADEYFAKEEIAYLHTLPEAERQAAFYSLWTLKESYTKNVGMGMSIPLNSFSFRLKPEQICLFVDGKQNTRFFFQTCDLDAHHKMALCVSGEEETNHRTGITFLTRSDIDRWKESFSEMESK